MSEDVLALRSIGVIRTPFADRASAPRQPPASDGAPGRIELLAGQGFEDALDDLAEWDHLWVLFWFHLNEGWRPKVLPPRSDRRRGVFATRSPHRPNPIGLSVVRLERVVGLTLHVAGVDMVDGTPVLDLKPYVPYCDCVPQATDGWLASAENAEARADPDPGFEVVFEAAALEQLSFLGSRGAELRGRVERTLAIGPRPHAYRRIRDEGNGVLRLAVADWRFRFRVEGRAIAVFEVSTGYRPKELLGPDGGAPELHRRFVERFGLSAPSAGGPGHMGSKPR